CLGADAIEGPLPETVGQTFLSASQETALRGEEIVSSAKPTELAPSVLAGNALTRGSTLAEAQTRQEPRDAGFPGGSLGISSTNSKAQAADKNVCPTLPPPPRDCSPAFQNSHPAAAPQHSPPDVKPIPANASA